MLERVIEIVGSGVAVARFEMGEAMERRTKSSRCVYAIIVGELEVGQAEAEHVQDLVDGGLELGITSARVPVGGPVQPGPIQHDLPPGMPERTNGVGATDPDGRIPKAIGEQAPTLEAEQADQVVVTIDVTIEGGLTDAELLGDPGERDRVDSLPVGDDPRNVEYPLLIQPLVHALSPYGSIV